MIPVAQAPVTGVPVAGVPVTGVSVTFITPPRLISRLPSYPSYSGYS